MKISKIIEHVNKVSIKVVILNNLWLKLLSLGIAIIIWLYVNGELTRGIRV